MLMELDAYFMQEIATEDIISISEISQGIFISGMMPITNKHYKKNIADHNIGVIVSMVEGKIPLLNTLENVVLKFYESVDNEYFSIDQYFDQVYSNLKEHLGKKNILIHCMEGKSRSVTIAIAVFLNIIHNKLCKEINHTDMILRFIKKKRKIAQPNSGFMEKLYKYEQSLIN